MKTWMIVVITAVAVLLLEFLGKKAIYPLIVYVVEKIQKRNELEKRVQYIEDKLDICRYEYAWAHESPYAEVEDDERKEVLDRAAKKLKHKKEKEQN